MRFKHFVQLAFNNWKAGNRVTYLLLGKPGIGKTACAWALSTMMTNHRRMSKPESPAALCEIFDLSSSLPEDLNGLPFRGQDNGTHNAPVARVMRCAAQGAYGVMCLDDLPASAPSVQVASRQAVLQRHFGETKIQDDVIMMVTGNRREDKSNASTLPAHFRNSVLMIDIDVDFEEWAEWAGEQSDMDPIVPSFLRWKPGHLATTPADADNRGVFATPRQWAQLGRLYQVAQSLQMDLEVAQGLVGEGIGSEFAAFVKVRSQLVEPGKVLRDPKGALPNPIAVLNSPDKMIAMATGLAEVAAGWFKDKDLSAKRRKEIPLEFFRAVSHITSQGGREYVSVSVNTFTANAGPQSLAVLVNSVRDNADNEEVRPMLEFLLKAFKGGR